MNYTPSSQMTTDLKLALGITDHDELLALILRITGQRVLNDINQKSMPKALEPILIDLAADAYRLNQQAIGGAAGEIVGTVSSVSDNGQSVSYRDSGYQDVLKSVMTILKNNEAQLARFRKTGW